MKCPFCGHQEDKVVDSRASQDGKSVRRRRECTECERRFTTYEHVEEISLMVIKKNGEREPFNKQKIISGIIKACEKRPVKTEDIYNLVNNIELQLQKVYEKEVESNVIGGLVVDALKSLDQVAYVRFASVYREFKDVNEFVDELKEIVS
ncbi:transcriptional regulator NrdR [bacterium]|nr:transcriptional regulator NrdR [bacterium]